MSSLRAHPQAQPVSTPWKRRSRARRQACWQKGINFLVLAFDTLGATHPSTITFLKRMIKDAKNRALCPDWRYAEQAWARIVVLQIDVARQILTRSVAPSLEVLQTPVEVVAQRPCP